MARPFATNAPSIRYDIGDAVIFLENTYQRYVLRKIPFHWPQTSKALFNNYLRIYNEAVPIRKK